MMGGMGPCLIACGILAAAASASASSPTPIALEPGEWLGADGNWSTVKFSVGSPSQQVNVLVSTSLSEFWTIGSGGCRDSDQQCITRRGGIFDHAESSDWFPLDFWELGLHWLGFGGNGEYGLDLVEARSSITGDTLSMKKVLLAAINTTDYFNGLFGLGIAQSNFGNRVAESPLTQAVMTYGYAPSYSYGFTAGAHYRNIPASVTLGGHDTSRYVAHDSEFTLTRSDGMPRPLIRGIEVSARDDGTRPDHWESRTAMLSDFDNSFVALIDSTTPHLWLPAPICDRFAEALNLTYNSTLDLYTVSDDVYRTYMSPDSFSFTFSLSSPDNTNELGSPLDVPGIVNITLSSRAFLTLLQYPFKHGVLNYGEPAVPSFSLRRAPGNSTFILGRAFLQESYLITKYDDQVYSVHQALYPDDPIADARIETIVQSPSSSLPPPAKRKLGSGGLTDAQKAGISVGVILGVSLIMIALWYFIYHRKRKAHSRVGNSSVVGYDKDSGSSVVPNTPKSPFSRILSFGGKRDRSQRGRSVTIVQEEIRTPTFPPHDTSHDIPPNTPHEAPNSEIHELPALDVPMELHAETMAPVELDAGDDGGTYATADDFEPTNTRDMTAYEISRRFIERQLLGPLPAYSPPLDGSLPPEEKSNPFEAPHEQESNHGPKEPPQALLRADSISQEQTSWISLSPEGSLRSPSPVSPWGEFPGVELSTLTGPETLSHSFSVAEPSGRRSYAGNSSSLENSGHESLRPPSTAARRSVIDPSNVVCLGPLSENIKLARLSHVPQYNFNTHEPTQSRDRSSQLKDLGSPVGMERIDVGEDIVHVPQLAAKRFSWEDPR